MPAPQVRMSAEQRRAQVVTAALAEFAQGGLHGTSTEAIASRAGISQPYLFRLFATKQELFVAAVDRCYANVLATFATAAAGLAGDAAMDAMGAAYKELLHDRQNLLAQLQMYAACDDPDIRRSARDGFRMLYQFVQNATGAKPAQLVMFFASGMLLNVVAALQLDSVEEPWAKVLRDQEGILGC